jgi:stress response protein SCP2
MSNDSQDFVWNIDWGDIPASDLAKATEPDPALPAPANPPHSPRVEPPLNIPAALPPPLPGAGAPPGTNRAATAIPPPSLSAVGPRAVVRGQRIKIADLGLRESGFSVGVQVLHSLPHAVDITCLGLDAQSRLSDERYFVFFNQPVSPCGGLALRGPGGDYQQIVCIDLSRLPITIERLVMVAAFDDDGMMARLGACRLSLLDADRSVAEFHFSGADFRTERAVTIAEVYRREGVWRFAAAGEGFSGGLAALLRHYGAQVAD